MISKLLIANRGEIARRVIRTAHDMGIRTVAIYAESDADAPFVTDAGEAWSLDGRTSAETYLDAAKVLDIAKRSGADAVHPGYGFLSENAGFARAVMDAGMTWVGPPPEAVAAMGDKLSAKRLADTVGVPTLASSTDPAAAGDVGYPLLVKAAAGGGGKGMRVVATPDELEAAVAAARREAGTSFGDDTVFLERYLGRPRHVEIQILGDAHGGLVHLGERECSIQRRHQKIIEEAPSPVVTPALRAQMGEAALRLAAALDYQSAGTVEFLVDGGGDGDGEDATFWFLEVNTRLQVEHPVTEAVILVAGTPLDLVREQLRVAMGEPLGYTQDDVVLRGHAVEARLYAEDPGNDFLPAIGTVVAWEESTSPTVRYDSGVHTGSVVGVEFDPMLAKVIAYAPTRTEAALRLALALERTRVQGLVTNRDFLVATLRTPAFLAGDTTTDFIDRVRPPRRHQPSDSQMRTAAVLAALWQQGQNRLAATALRTLPSGWRNSAMPPQRLDLLVGDDTIGVRYAIRRDGAFDVTFASVDGFASTATVVEHRADGIDAVLDGRRVSASVRRDGARFLVHGPDGDLELIEQPRFPDPRAELPSGGLQSPMPGRVLEVRAAAGDRVAKGQVLVVMEAMKMEHHLAAGADGVVAEVRVAVGDQVDGGALLLVVDVPDAPDEA